jgi:hypothetical protein
VLTFGGTCFSFKNAEFTYVQKCNYCEHCTTSSLFFFLAYYSTELWFIWLIFINWSVIDDIPLTHTSLFFTGDIEDFPGLDSLPCFQVEVQDGGGVKVRGKKSEVKSSKRVKDMVSRNEENTTTFVVVGGGELYSYPYCSEIVSVKFLFHQCVR